MRARGNWMCGLCQEFDAYVTTSREARPSLSKRDWAHPSVTMHDLQRGLPAMGLPPTFMRWDHLIPKEYTWSGWLLVAAMLC